jgi:hypothetical protein
VTFGAAQPEILLFMKRDMRIARTPRISNIQVAGSGAAEEVVKLSARPEDVVTLRPPMQRKRDRAGMVEVERAGDKTGNRQNHVDVRHHSETGAPVYQLNGPGERVRIHPWTDNTAVLRELSETLGVRYPEIIGHETGVAAHES